MYIRLIRHPCCSCCGVHVHVAFCSHLFNVQCGCKKWHLGGGLAGCLGGLWPIVNHQTPRLLSKRPTLPSRIVAWCNLPHNGPFNPT